MCQQVLHEHVRHVRLIELLMVALLMLKDIILTMILTSPRHIQTIPMFIGIRKVSKQVIDLMMLRIL